MDTQASAGQATEHAKWIKDRRAKAQTAKLSEENTGTNLHDLGLSSGFLNMTAKTRARKEK